MSEISGVSEIRSEGGVLLISCYELGRPPVGIALAAAFLEPAGFSPRVVDLAVERLEDEEIKRARLVAIAVPMHTALRVGVRVADRIRDLNPCAHITFFGHYAALNSEQLLEGRADSVLAGELEDALVHLATWIAERGDIQGGDPMLPGITTRSRVEQPVLTKLRFRSPARGRLPPLASYAKLDLGGELRLAGAVEASRGCLHVCRHCPIPPIYGGRFFVIPEDVVLADVRALVTQGARHISFSDPDFLNGPGHAFRIAHALRGIDSGLTFDFTAKVEHLLRHRSRLGELVSAGCVFVVSAIESMEDRVLTVLDKGHTKADTLSLLDVFEDHGLSLRPSLLPFTPWSTLEGYLELLDLILTRDLVDSVDPIQLTIRLLVPPGSLLETHPEMTPHLKRLTSGEFSWAWTHPDPRLDPLWRAACRVVQGTIESEGSTQGSIEGSRRAPRELFERLRDLALALLEGGRDLEPRPTTTPFRATDARAKPPRVVARMTEPWFC